MVISRTIDKFAKDHSCVIAIYPEHGGRWLSTINDSTNLIQPQMTNTKVVVFPVFDSSRDIPPNSNPYPVGNVCAATS